MSMSILHCTACCLFAIIKANLTKPNIGRPKERPLTDERLRKY